MNRYYWEALFSIEYFPYWEFTMVMMLAMLLSILWRLNRMETKLDDTNVTVNYLFTKEIEGE
jgi:type II secretory pathway component PulC